MNCKDSENGRPWVAYNHLTATYDKPDGTKVAAELVDNAQCLLDILHISIIRHNQRKAIKATKETA